MIASQFLKNLKQIKISDLAEVKGLGVVLIENFSEFINSPRYTKLVSQFEALEAKNIQVKIITKPKMSSANLPLSNQIICITGTFEISRNEIKKKLESLGASVTDAVSNKTTILLAGQNSGSKLSKAEKMNIKIVRNLNLILTDY